MLRLLIPFLPKRVSVYGRKQYNFTRKPQFTNPNPYRRFCLASVYSEYSRVASHQQLKATKVRRIVSRLPFKILLFLTPSGSARSPLNELYYVNVMVCVADLVIGMATRKR
jgi:hypothetical protein